MLMEPGQQYSLDQIRKAISSERIASYLSQFNQNESAAYGAYAWNIALCESFYPALQGIEITLRNGVNEAAVAEFGTGEWFLLDVEPSEKKIANDTTSILKSKKKALTPSNYVSEFTFGFWVSLFSGRYHQGAWPSVLTSPFAHAPKKQRSPKLLRTRLEKIRRLRNRVFHHEPAWHWVDLETQHSHIIETIGWISPAMRRFVEMLDRFPEVYGQGRDFHEQRLTSVFQG